MPNPIRVLVVDDSALMRTMVHRALIKDGDIVVVGEARDSAEARQMIKAHNPDVITLDVEMPGMNGLAFLEKIMTLRPMPVIMVSSLTAKGTETALNALEIGAVDTIAKPSSPEETRAFGQVVRAKARVAATARVQARKVAAVARPTGQGLARTGAMRPARQVIAIGASTGGVGAIGDLFQDLSRGLPPIVLTIHMPAAYTGRFADRLAREFGRDVAEARDNEVISNDMIRVAPGSRHLEIHRSGSGYVTRLGGETLVSGHCPSVDVLFRSVSTSVGKEALGLILTGMGRDGASGMLEMKKNGAQCLGQTEESCVVYGMPKAAVANGAVSKEFDLPGLCGQINLFASKDRSRVAV